jgi:tRNA threonylcarbamoyladenosine biosynthesis protein TsaB
MKNLILGIDCSGAMTSIGLASAEENLGETNLLLGRRQSQELPRMVSEMLRLWGAEPRDLSALAVTRGPGFFSGIRVGMAYVLSLAFSLKIPVIPLSSLEVLAFGVAVEGIPVISLLPAKRGAFFYGAYMQENDAFHPLEEEVFLSLSQVVERGRELSRHSSVLCGIDASCADMPVFPEMPVIPAKTHVQGLKLLALARRKEPQNPRSIEASYLRITW